MDHARLPADPRRQYRDLRLRARRRLRLPGAGGAVREPHAAARRHPDRADVPGGLDHRRHHARPGQQHPHPGRLHRADRPRGQECDSDRGVRQAARGSGPHPLPGGGRGGAPAAASHPDDLARVHLRGDAARLGHRRRRRAAPDARNRGVRGHDRGDRVRADLHADLLRRQPLDRGEGGAAARGHATGAGGVGAGWILP